MSENKENIASILNSKDYTDGQKKRIIDNYWKQYQGGKKYQVIKLFTMVLTLFYTISCNSNQIFFDEKRQQIVSCYTIVALDVLDLKTGDIYFVEKIADNTAGAKVINLNSLPKNYNVYQNSHNNPLWCKCFIKPNRIYEIVNISIGDAGRWKIRLSSDNNGKLHSVPVDKSV